MGKTIIIAGAGHGGLAAGALLAEKGFDVTVYEKKKEMDAQKAEKERINAEKQAEADSAAKQMLDEILKGKK